MKESCRYPFVVKAIALVQLSCVLRTKSRGFFVHASLSNVEYTISGLGVNSTVITFGSADLPCRHQFTAWFGCL